MADTFSTSSRNSWGSRIVGSIVGVIIGLLMIPGSMILLSWNEANSIDTEKSLKEGAAAVVDIEPGKVDPANNAKLIHVSGDATAEEKAVDSDFGVSVAGLRLTRSVEMYQWTETQSSEEKKNLGGSTETVTTYTYKKDWSPRLIDSSDFKQAQGHENPTQMLAQADTFLAPKITLGAFTLPRSIVDQMHGDIAAKPTQAEFDALPEDLKTKGHFIANGFYFGPNPSAAAIGDQRVTFEVLQPGTFSILAQQNGSTFQPYLTKKGKEIERVEPGAVSADLMFKRAQDENRMMTWLLRIGGFALMLFGFALILGPLGVLADVIPFLGNLVGAGTFLTSLLLAAVGTIATVAVAWLAVRPLLGGALVAVATAGLIWTFMIGAKKRKLAKAS